MARPSRGTPSYCFMAKKESLVLVSKAEGNLFLRGSFSLIDLVKKVVLYKNITYLEPYSQHLIFRNLQMDSMSSSVCS